MYYQNIAADALVKVDLNRAFAYADQRLAIDPNNYQILNTLAVIHRRTGDNLTAENYIK